MVCLKNKTVVISGASSGIGKATALEFAKKGANVVLAARRIEKLKDIEKEIRSFNKNCISVKTDITNPDEVTKLFKIATDKFNNIDVLINNAGKGLKAKLVDIDYKDWQSTINVNLNGVFLCTREAARLMIKKNTKGHIITVSSLAGIFNIPGYSGYCCSKHAVNSFNSSIKWELKKHNIKVSTINPYKVDTEFFSDYKKRPGRGQMLSPRDVAHNLVAIAENNLIKRIYVRIINFLKRIYYLFRYMF